MIPSKAGCSIQEPGIQESGMLAETILTDWQPKGPLVHQAAKTRRSSAGLGSRAGRDSHLPGQSRSHPLPSSSTAKRRCLPLSWGLAYSPGQIGGGLMRSQAPDFDNFFWIAIGCLDLVG